MKTVVNRLVVENLIEAVILLFAVVSSSVRLPLLDPLHAGVVVLIVDRILLHAIQIALQGLVAVAVATVVVVALGAGAGAVGGGCDALRPQLDTVGCDKEVINPCDCSSCCPRCPMELKLNSPLRIL